MINSFIKYLKEGSGSAKERLMSRVTKLKNGCWKYRGHNTKYDYGQVWSNGQARPSHKVAYEAFKGKVPAGKVVRHKCNHRYCCNPAHLTLGSSAENNQDISKAGRVRNQWTGPLKDSPRGKGQIETKSKGWRQKYGKK